MLRFTVFAEPSHTLGNRSLFLAKVLWANSQRLLLFLQEQILSLLSMFWTSDLKKLGFPEQRTL
jgi:hypothetical protein